LVENLVENLAVKWAVLLAAWKAVQLEHLKVAHLVE
jgi:hypothetical protein